MFELRDKDGVLKTRFSDGIATAVTQMSEKRGSGAWNVEEAPRFLSRLFCKAKKMWFEVVGDACDLPMLDLVEACA